jgi:hypothetical protein
MMGYLQANSRPDVTFAVSQCARLKSSRRRSHEQALERIGQYAIGTIPSTLGTTFTTDVYVDADFAGGRGYEDPTDPICVKSRTGFIIEKMGCPILDVQDADQHRTSMEAEYTALSIALRAAIPLLDVIKYVVRSFNVTASSLLTFKTTVHEDNQDALRLANMEPGIKLLCPSFMPSSIQVLVEAKAD